MKVNGTDYGGEDSVAPIVIRGAQPGRIAPVVIREVRPVRVIEVDIVEAEREIARIEQALAAMKLNLASARTAQEERIARRARGTAWNMLRRWQERRGLLAIELRDTTRIKQGDVDAG